SVTTSFELGKFFPDKAKVTAPIYYSVTKESNSPKYTPLDTDMRLKDALDALETKRERDSLENIAVSKSTTTNFSLSNVRVGIQNKRHPTPIDPANFSLSYSHSHRYTSGETTVYEKEDQWRGALAYNWTPVFKPLEPFKKIKSKSKYYDILKKFGLNWLPQSVAFNTEISRIYSEQQKRDMEDLGGSKLPLIFNQQFLWNREFSLRWDLTKNLHMSFNSATHAEIEEPYTPVNKDLYPERYQAWKDSVKMSLRNFGRPLTYNQSFQASYKVPIELIPIFDWVSTDAAYNSTYNWQRGTDLDDGTSLGNTIATHRTLKINGAFNLEKLYSHVPFLKKANDRLNKEPSRSQIDKERKDRQAKKQAAKQKKEEAAQNGEGDNAQDKNAKNAKDAKDSKDNKKKELPKNKKGFEKEITLLPDTTIEVNHGKKTKRLIVSAKTEDGKAYPVKFKKVDDNKIKITSRVDSALKLKVTVTPKDPLEDKGWYRTAECIARVLMMVRNVNFSYQNNYSLSLPGFLPNIGKAFGQTNKTSVLSPGLDYAFGFVGDSYIERARENNWLLHNESVATPATSSKTEDLQMRMTLEPVKNFKIDLNAARTMTTSKSVQYMYEGNPTTQNGTFTMTTLSLKSAFEGMGNANNGYKSNSFLKFCNSLSEFRERVEAQYTNSVYPKGTTLAGKTFNPENGGVNMYSADVMIPAFLASYTGMGGKSLSIFPSLSKLLPNWTIRYSGLSKLPWLREHFKSVNLNHSYKSIYAVGSYTSYSTFMEYMNGLGFIKDATTGNPVPNSMFNVSTVSINEAFSPLLGIDVTMHNNMTCKLEYRSTRVLTLSMTSIQISEAVSHDWVIGMGYKINNFNFFGMTNHRAVKGKKKGNGQDDEKQNANSKATQRGKTQVNHDLNLRLDFSFRKQAAITRDIASMTSSASSGNSALKLSFMAD
ncbi:MAG: cell surface protein SprA, partial [Prevotella sp.]|nr:cell surface protein SprA [Prevotella sp.]